MPVSIKGALLSVHRHGEPLIRCSLTPERDRRLEMVSSLYSVGNSPLLWTRVGETSAIPSAFLWAVPLEITVDMLADRNRVGRCSPRTQRMASTILDFPQPLGPTIAVI